MLLATINRQWLAAAIVFRKKKLRRRLTSTPRGVDVADGGSKPPQPMAPKQPMAARSRLG